MRDVDIVEIGFDSKFPKVIDSPSLFVVPPTSQD